MVEKTLESPLDCKEIKRVNPKGNQPWIFTGRTDAETEVSILWPPNVKSLFTGKDPDGREDWGQEEKVVTEDKMVGWHHWYNGHEFEQTLGDSEGQGSLVCWSPWGCKEMDTAWWLNNNNSLCSNIPGVLKYIFLSHYKQVLHNIFGCKSLYKAKLIDLKVGVSKSTKMVGEFIYFFARWLNKQSKIHLW